MPLHRSSPRKTVDPEQPVSSLLTDTSPPAASPSAASPSAVGPSAVGPSAVSPSAVGPSAVGPSAADPTVVDPPAANLPDSTRPPTAKLASVTRKRNEIECLFNSFPLDFQEIKVQYEDYLTRLFVLIEATPAEHKNWLDVNCEINRRFKIKVHNLLYGNLPSVKSSHSTKSSISLRLKIAEQRAKINAERETERIAIAMKLEENRLKAKYEEELILFEQKKKEISK